MQNEIIELLRKYTKHDFIKLTTRGNASIFNALLCSKFLNPKKYFIYPDQGGWISYQNYPKKMEMLYIEVKTDFGVISIEDLNNKVDEASALIYSNPAGYYAEQPMKEIYKVCKDKCLVILDASGSIGSSMCNGEYADMIVGSFGKWKPVNLDYGGFLATKEERFMKKIEELKKNGEAFKDVYYEILVNKLKNVQERYKFFESVNEKIKNDLNDFNILHRDKKGINVIVKFENDEEKAKIIKYCEENKYEYTTCPKYIRVNTNAISIEVKRLQQ